jgi:hypothetical protein
MGAGLLLDVKSGLILFIKIYQFFTHNKHVLRERESSNIFFDISECERSRFFQNLYNGSEFRKAMKVSEGLGLSRARGDEGSYG